MFSEAKLFCNQRDMEMTAPFSDSSNNMMLELHSMATGMMWIDFVNKDGQFNLTTAYANWDTDHSPEDKSSGTHAVMRADGKWRVLSDPTERRNVVCIKNGKSLDD